MEKIKSLGWFCWGLLKRGYYWGPFVLLDVADLWGLYLDPALERISGSEVEMPDTAIWMGAGIGVAWSAILTYHEERIDRKRIEKKKDGEINRLREELYPPLERQRIRAGLRPIIDDGRELAARLENVPDRPPGMDFPGFDDVGRWWDEAEHYVREHLDEDELQRIRTAPRKNPYEGANVHGGNTELYRILANRLTRLEQLLIRLGG